MLEIDMNRELVLTFTREGEVADRFYCQDGMVALKLAMVILVMQTELQEGDVLAVERRQRGNLIERGLG
jgi:hypothetical protein